MKIAPFKIFVAIAFIVIAGGFVLFRSSPEKPELLMDTVYYIDYSEVDLENAKIKGKPILFFAATLWCQTCSELEKEILERSGEIPTEVTILKVDYDNDKVMNAKWGVTNQHTLVVLDENGQEVKRWVGGNFDAMIKNIQII